jgi:hypothetical protein
MYVCMYVYIQTYILYIHTHTHTQKTRTLSSRFCTVTKITLRTFANCVVTEAHYISLKEKLYTLITDTFLMYVYQLVL